MSQKGERGSSWECEDSAVGFGAMRPGQAYCNAFTGESAHKRGWVSNVRFMCG